MTDSQPAASEEPFEPNIFFIRGQNVMHGIDLAEAFGIEPQAVDQAVERNIGLFPEGSVFRLNAEEFAGLKAHHVISNPAAFYAFTRHGVGILSSILFDERAMRESQESCAPTCDCRK
ncbi:MAG: ORF6N domain-containing protein [Nitrosomonadales bacterium]|nr:ORF6N domain-containing protein [Nitrosomonadales bacterium]